MAYEHIINAASWNLWGKVFDKTSKGQNFTITIKGLAKKGIGDYIEELVDEQYAHTAIVETQSWWSKALYVRYFAIVASAIESIEEEGYSIQFEYSDSAVDIHCTANR